MMLRQGGIPALSLRKYKGILLLVGFAFVILQAIGKSNRWGFYEYFGWLAIPILLLGVWLLIPDREWPKGLTSCAFSIFILHRFFFQVGALIVGGCNTLLSYAFVAFFMFVVSLVVATLLKRIMPRLSRIAFGGR